MLKMLAAAALAVLMTACAVPSPVASGGSTASGEATAAQMGFHGPVDRANKTDGPN
jgi:hypothetical protein